MTSSIPTVVLGGGLAGMAAAYELARAGFEDITLVERNQTLGGLAGTFERDGHFYPLAYHHINPIDRPLLHFFKLIGSLDRVCWKRVPMLFRVEGRLYDLAQPEDFLRFPLPVVDKVRFARLMLRAYLKSDWGDWHQRSAAELVDSWAGERVRRAIFDPLCRLKFDLPAEEVSGAWLGARLHHREGAAALGYIPGHNWTQVLCDGIHRLLVERGVRIRTGSAVTRLRVHRDRVTDVELANGDRLPSGHLVSAIPTSIYCRLIDDNTPDLASIRYTAVVSFVCTVDTPIRRDFYWLNLGSPRCHASAIFLLNSLNSTIGAPGEYCLNFVTHLRSTDDTFFGLTDEELLACYGADFWNVFATALKPKWVHIARIPLYSPILVRGYRNPPLRSQIWRNVVFAGNYRTFPSLVSTGTALASGAEAAGAILGRPPLTNARRSPLHYDKRDDDLRRSLGRT